MTLVPKKGLAAQREKELEEKLEAYRSSLSEEQLDAMVEKTKALEAYQEAGEDPKALECIPMLKRSDIKKEAAKIVNEELTVDNSLFLYHDVCTNGIGYVDLMFKTDSIAPEQIPYLGLLKSVLGYVDTEHYTYREHSLKLFCRISSVKNLYPTVDTACIGIDLIKQFSVCVILCIHITQYGFQKSQIRNLLRRNTVSLKHQVYVTDAICAYVMVKEQTVIYR